jgi:anti-anti-sigma factor
MSLWKKLFMKESPHQSKEQTSVASFVGSLPKKALAQNLGKLRGEILAAILSNRVGRIILDCSGTDIMDSAALGILCQVKQEAQPRGIPVILVGLKGTLRELFKITRLDTMFSLFDTMPNGCDAPAPKLGPFADSHPVAAYRKHDFIGPSREVLGVLNTGGMGVVYLVQNSSDHSLRVVKTLRDEFIESASARHRFLREAGMWCHLDANLFIVRALSTFEYEKRPYIELEYISPDQVDGSVTLRDRIRTTGGPLPLRRTLRWGIQVCMAMQHATAQGIVCHRDIKPENLMICRHTLQEGGVTVISSRLRILKITDFGLAKAGDLENDATMCGPAVTNHQRAMSLSLTGRFCGTPPYMPPEQFDRANEADVRNDIYSLGVVLYEIACGHRPFQPQPTAKDPIIAWHRLHASEPVPRIDGPLWPILEKCLEKRPERRFEHFDHLKSELDVLDGQVRDDWSFPYPF